MTTTVDAINPKPTKTYSRAELQQTMDGWLEANRRAEAAGDWITYLGPFYTDDAVYRWNVGPNEEFVARGHRRLARLVGLVRLRVVRALVTFGVVASVELVVRLVRALGALRALGAFADTALLELVVHAARDALLRLLLLAFGHGSSSVARDVGARRARVARRRGPSGPEERVPADEPPEVAHERATLRT